MKQINPRELLRSVLIGKRYYELTSIDEQARYMTMNAMFMIIIIPFVVLGTILIGVIPIRVVINYGIAFLFLLSLILMLIYHHRNQEHHECRNEK